MKAAILKVLAELPFLVLAYHIKDERCHTLGEFADKLAKRYNREDVKRINADLLYCYECYLEKLHEEKQEARS